MTKVAIMELGTNQIKLSIVKIEENKYFEIQKEFSEYVGIDKHLEDSGLINTAKIKECIAILRMYKEIAISYGVTKFSCIASFNLTKAKNYPSFIEEAGSDLDLEFRLLSEEEEMNTLYSAVVNSIDISKGVIIAISTASTRIIHYCRRVILNSVSIPIGVANFTDAETFRKSLEQVGENFLQIDSEVNVIGSCEVFTSFSRLSRKKRKYSFEADHNYTTNKNNFLEILEFLKGLDVEKSAKLRGISANGVGYLMNGMEIALEIMNYANLKNIIINRSGRNVGLSYRLTMTEDEKPISDVFNTSLENIIWANDLDMERAKGHYLLASTLYSQLKVLHKLPRSYSKILKTATLLYTLGSNINKLSYEKLTYYAILNSRLNGLSHREIVMSAFVAGCRSWDDFMLSEWVKHKDMMSEDDLESVRKMSIITAMADVMNLRKQSIIKDISCDILGDSVIIKLITDTDYKNPTVDIDAAQTEIFCLKKLGKEFTKIFKKNVEIL